MKLTTKGRYAVTAMLDLAIHYDKGPVTLADISRRQGISLSYLEQLFAKLRKSELVKSVRGPGGGYLISRNARDINIAEVIDSVSENVDATRCGGAGDCQDGNECLSHQLWCDLSEELYRFLESISLASVIEKHEVQKVAQRQESELKTDFKDTLIARSSL
ncbi:MAG: Fe-S cluster assembly transcriptional regulator IscR [Pseudomonadota bacterium]